MRHRIAWTRIESPGGSGMDSGRERLLAQRGGRDAESDGTVASRAVAGVRNRADGRYVRGVIAECRMQCITFTGVDRGDAAAERNDRINVVGLASGGIHRGMDGIAEAGCRDAEAVVVKGLRTGEAVDGRSATPPSSRETFA